MKKNQNGFSAIEALLVLVVVGLVGFIGWYVWNNNKSAQPKTNSASNNLSAVTTVSATDTAKTFSYSYPSNWSVQKYVWTDCCESTTVAQPDWAKVPQPIKLKENKTTVDAAISITGDNTGANSVDKEYNNRIIDQFNTYTELKLNGYDALYHVTDFVGPSSAEKYKDVEYLLVDGNKSVQVMFEERYSNSTLNGSSDFNASNLAPDFTKIVNSVKFLN
jgi:Tfp pilus assembly protein PilV